ncbi:MAG: beta-lactamase family protein [Clostridiales bacterium]|nr:beta-lactamase family protein [Clostridiales bacterium]
MKSKIFTVISLILILSVVFTACNSENAVTNDNTAPDESSASSLEETTSTTEDDVTTDSQEVSFEWQKDSPENQGTDSSVLSDLHNTYENNSPVLASCIVKNGVIIDEYYKDGYDETSIFEMNSASKSITSAVFGIATDKGYIDSTDTLISEYFPEILSSQSDYKKQITIWNLLTHTSGFDYTDDSSWYEWRASENWVEYILESAVTAEPGTTFRYSTGNTHLLSAILQQATDTTLYEFAKEYLFDKVGMDSVTCETDSQGISDGGNGFSMNIYDMLKFGQLYLNNGVWQGEQIISSDWIKESTSVQFKRSSGTADYGYQWWVRTFQGYDAYFAQGHGGQFIFVIPELELVIAFTSNNTSSSSSMYWEYVNDIVLACI